MPPQEPGDLAFRLLVLILSLTIQASLAAGYSLAAMGILRWVGPWALALMWAVTAGILGAVVFLFLPPPSLDQLRVIIVMMPVSATAGASILVWLLHRRRPDAGMVRTVLHGMAGFGLSLFAVMLVVCGMDIARWA